MNLFFYTFLETALASKYILWASFLVSLCLLYIFIIRFLVGKKSYDHLKKNLFGNDLFQKSVSHHKDHSVLQTDKIVFKKLFHLYEQADISISWRLFRLSFLLAIFVSFLWGLVIFKSIAFSVFLAFFAGVFGVLFLITKAQKRKKKMVEQLPVFLQAMASTLQAGYSIPNALEFLENEIEFPLQQEIRKINQKRALKISLQKSLEDFAKAVHHPEIYFFVESTIIQLKTGGNLIKLFKKISYLIEEKLKLERDMKSFTSQGKLSGILIALLWPISLSFFYFFSPQHTDILFHTSAGKGLLIFSLLLEGLGFFFIWRIVKVKI